MVKAQLENKDTDILTGLPFKSEDKELTNEEKQQKLADYIYGAVASTDEDGNQPTWAQIREQYSATVDSEIKDMNKRLSELNK